MEAMMKKYFWTVNLVFLAIGAWLLANMTNVVVAHKLRPLPSLPKQTSKQNKQKNPKDQVENNGVIADRNFFGSAMAAPVETVEEGPDLHDPGTLDGEGVESTLRATLVGTIVADDPQWSMAMITDLAASETDVYRVDQTIMEEAKVVAILSRKVILHHNGVLEYLELQDKAEPNQPRPGGRTPHVAAGDDKAGEGIKKVGQDKWAIDRDEIDKTLSNLNSIAMQARIVPSFKDGEANGFKLFAIRPNSLYSKLGIQNGDIIHKINGFAINSPDKALEIYQKLKNAHSIDIELTRRGKSKKLNYRIE
jgi:general secretion pathway protein C